MSSRVHFEKSNGKLTQAAREILAEQFAALPDGWHTNDITPGRRGYTPTRYRFYHDVILWCILTQAGRFYRITNPSTGEERIPRNTAELHECIKAIYNPVILITPNGKTRVIAGTTTDLTDSEFIEQFQEQIVADHSQDPYLVEFVDIETWRAKHNDGTWRDFKKAREAAPQET